MVSGPFCPPRALTPHALAQEISALRQLRERLLAEPYTASVLVQVIAEASPLPIPLPVWLPGHALASLCAARIAGLEAAVDAFGEAGAGVLDTERRS